MEKSETVGALAAALAKAQGEFEAIPFNTTNKFLGNRYADLGAVIETAKPVVARYGLSVVQLTENGAEGSIGITTILMHASGEWLSSFISLPMGEEKGKSRAQVAGSIISYLRRYAYTSMLGLYAEEETDGSTDPHQAVSNRREQEKGGTVAETTRGRPTAKDMRDKAQQEVAGEPGAMPDKPGEIVAWFNGEVAAEPARSWDAETHAAAAKRLAIAFKEAGIGDQQRRLVYLALTGKEHGGDMRPQQMVALSRTITKPQQLLGVARWYTERNSQQGPADGG